MPDPADLVHCRRRRLIDFRVRVKGLTDGDRAHPRGYLAMSWKNMLTVRARAALRGSHRAALRGSHKVGSVRMSLDVGSAERHRVVLQPAIDKLRLPAHQLIERTAQRVGRP